MAISERYQLRQWAVRGGSGPMCRPSDPLVSRVPCEPKLGPESLNRRRLLVSNRQVLRS